MFCLIQRYKQFVVFLKQETQQNSNLIFESTAHK